MWAVAGEGQAGTPLNTEPNPELDAGLHPKDLEIMP